VRKKSISKMVASNRSRKAMAPMVPAMKKGGSAKKPKVGIAIMIAVGKKGKK